MWCHGRSVAQIYFVDLIFAMSPKNQIFLSHKNVVYYFFFFKKVDFGGLKAGEKGGGGGG